MAFKFTEPHRRFRHVSAAVGGEVCVWGGRNISLWKKKEWSSLHLFHPLAETWTTSECSGTPPLGLEGCSCTSEGHSLFIYGGQGVEGDYQSTLHKLDTTSCAWTLLSSDGPRKAKGCGILKYGNHLFLFGGYDSDHSSELHMFDMTEGEKACS
jgi:N-acetylneuraminic acid mutarotase